MKIFRLGFWLPIHVFLHCVQIDAATAQQLIASKASTGGKVAEVELQIIQAGTKDLPEADVAVYPWSAIGKLNNSIGGSCTAAVVEQDLALTVAHCIFNRRTGRFLPASSLHLLLGFKRGDYVVHALVSSYTVGPGYDPMMELETIESDWVLLKLTNPLPATIRPLALIDTTPRVGTQVMIGSYARGRRFVMTVDRECALIGASAKPVLLEHDCRVAQGSSGAPLLMMNHDTAVIVGLQVGMGKRNGVDVMLAVSGERIGDLAH